MSNIFFDCSFSNFLKATALFCLFLSVRTELYSQPVETIADIVHIYEDSLMYYITDGLPYTELLDSLTGTAVDFYSFSVTPSKKDIEAKLLVMNKRRFIEISCINFKNGQNGSYYDCDTTLRMEWNGFMQLDAYFAKGHLFYSGFYCGEEIPGFFSPLPNTDYILFFRYDSHGFDDDGELAPAHLAGIMILDLNLSIVGQINVKENKAVSYSTFMREKENQLIETRYSIKKRHIDSLFLSDIPIIPVMDKRKIASYRVHHYDNNPPLWMYDNLDTWYIEKL